jgi:hypothetical protein
VYPDSDISSQYLASAASSDAGGIFSEISKRFVKAWTAFFSNTTVATATPASSSHAVTPTNQYPPVKSETAPSAITQNIVNRSVTERVVENIIYTGVSEERFAAKLSDLENKLNARISSVIPNQNPNPYAFPSGGGITSPIIHTVVSSGSSVTDAGSLTGTLAVSHGGTGITTSPSYGQLLLGNSSGGYDLVATSSLGISGSGLSGSGADNTFAYFSGGALSGTTSPTVGYITATSTSATSTFAWGVSVKNLQITNLASCDTIDTDAGGYLKCSSDATGSGAGSPGGADTQVQYNTNGNFGGDAGFTYASSTDTLTVVNASTTRVSASYASSTQGIFGSLSVGTLSGFLKATAGALSTAVIDLASDVGSSILSVANGGTGWSNLQANTVLLGNGTSRIATTSAGTNGQVLALYNGVPTWVATSSINNGVSSIQHTYGSPQTGALTFATSSAISFNGLSLGQTITNSSGTFTYTPTLTGTLDNTGLTNSSVSFGGVSVSLGGSDATPAFDLTDATNLPIVAGTTGTLSIARGGTGTTTAPVGHLIYGGASAYQSVATSSISLGASLSTTAGSLGYQVGGSNVTINTVQDIRTSASPTFAGLTLTSFSGFLKATAGVVSTSLVNLASDITGTLGIANGGTGTTTTAAGYLTYWGSSTQLGVATTSVSCSGSVSCTSFTAIGASPITISGSGGGSWPFTPTTYAGSAVQSTSTPLWLTATAPFSLIASSTFATSASVASSTPWGLLSVNPDGNSGPSFVIGSSTKTDLLVDNAGSVAIGTTTASLGTAKKKFAVETNPGPTDAYGAIYGSVYFTPTVSHSGGATATFGDLQIYGSTDYASALIGLGGRVFYNGSATLSDVRGTNLVARNRSTGTLTSAYGFNAELYNDSTGTITAGRAGRFVVSGATGGTIGSAYGTYVSIANSGTMTNTYGVYVDDITSGTQTNTPYSFYAADAGAYNYFAGNTGIGTTTPQFLLSSYSASAPQLSLSAGAGIAQWTFRNSGGTFYLATTTTDGTATSTSPALAVSSIGRVGLGTAASAYPLEVAASGGNQNGSYVAYFSRVGGSVGVRLGANNAAGIVGGYPINGSTATALAFNVYSGSADSEVGRFSSAGLFGIGSTTPWGLLSVNPNALGSGVPEFVVGSSTATHLIVTGAGNVGVGTTSPYQALSVNGNFAMTNGNIMSNNVVQLLTPTNTAQGLYSAYLWISDSYVAASPPTNGAYIKGNVGIGTTSPSTKLHIAPVLYANNQAGGILLSNTTNAVFDSSIFIRSDAAGNARLSLSGPGNTDDLVILDNGNIGVGTTSPFALFSVSGGKVAFKSTASTTAAFAVENDYGRNVFQVDTLDNATSIFSVATTTGGTYFTIAAAGNTGVGTSTPWKTLSIAGTGAWSGLDTAASGNVVLCINATSKLIREGSSATSCTPSSARFKNTIATSTVGLAELKLLRPVTFYFNDKGDPTEQLGFIAEEAFAVDPRLVNLDPEGKPYSLKLDNFISLTVSSVQELNLNMEAIAFAPATTTPQAQSFADAFFGNLFSRLTIWFSDSANGIGKFFAGEVHTKQICVAKSDGTEFCADGDALAALAAAASVSSAPPPPTVSDAGGETPPPDDTEEITETPPEEPPADSPAVESAPEAPPAE